MGDWWLAAWTDHSYHLSAQQFMVSYLAFVVGGFLLALVRAFLFTLFALSAAAGLHDQMATHILRAPQVFFDQVRASRLRFSLSRRGLSFSSTLFVRSASLLLSAAL